MPFPSHSPPVRRLYPHSPLCTRTSRWVDRVSGREPALANHLEGALIAWLLLGKPIKTEAHLFYPEGLLADVEVASSTADNGSSLTDRRAVRDSFSL